MSTAAASAQLPNARPLPEAPLGVLPPDGITREEAAAELWRRQRARGSLLEYARSIDIPGAPLRSDDEDSELFKPVELALAAHHALMLRWIEATLATPMGRLMLFMPPGSAKSTYSSVVAPVHQLSRVPGYRIIQAGYAAKIAWKQSRKARALVKQPRQLAIWEDRPMLESATRAADHWGLTNGSEYSAFGIQAGITGNRANAFIGDDLIAGREEADSDVIRDKTFDEFTDSATTRLMPGGSIILCNTRWHEDDVCGRLLPEGYAGQSGRILGRDGQWWQVINLPAKCEYPDDPLGRQIGEYIWPEWFPTSHWAQWEHNPRAARTWSALFQQRPTAGEGLEFKREWFKWYDPDVTPGQPGGPPERLRTYGASDEATKEDKGDYTEHGVVGIDQMNGLWFLDWWFGQKTTDVTVNAFVDLVARHHPMRWWNEGGPIDNALAPAKIRAMRENHPPVYVHIEPLPSIKNKVLKAASFQARAAAGLVHLPLKREWAKRLVDQLCAFPGGKYDDAVDVCGLIGRGIDAMMAPHRQTHEERKVIKPFTGAWVECDDSPILTPRYN